MTEDTSTPRERAIALVSIAHQCVDWDIWGGPKARRYWDGLTGRVRAACYSGRTLADWWERLTRTMSLHPPGRKEDRARLAELLTAGDDAAVLAELRARTEVIVLTVRVVVDEAKTAREAVTA